MEGGLLGAYERTKRRHQNKYASNPNPNRARQQVARRNMNEPAQELVDDKINLHQLQVLLAEFNGGESRSTMCLDVTDERSLSLAWCMPFDRCMLCHAFAQGCNHVMQMCGHS